MVSLHTIQVASAAGALSSLTPYAHYYCSSLQRLASNHFNSQELVFLTLTPAKPSVMHQLRWVHISV